MEATRTQTHPSTEPEPGAKCPRRVLAIVNPHSGTAAADAIRSALATCFPEHEENHLELHEIAKGDDLGALIRDRLVKGVDLVIAAGGDGTVSSVGHEMAGTGVPMGVIPMGTANVLARELNIPTDVEAAGRLLVSEHRIATIDAMKVNGRHYLTQLGVGLDAMMIRETSTEEKRRFGKLAYLWTAVTQLAGHHRHRFRIVIDGDKTIQTHASQVIVANVGMLGQPPFRWGPDIKLDDGKLDVFISKAKSLFHYVALAWHVVTSSHKSDPNVRYEKASASVSIETRHPLPVQADGEIIGETPVRVEIARGVLKVIAPKETDDARD